MTSASLDVFSFLGCSGEVDPCRIECMQQPVDEEKHHKPGRHKVISEGWKQTKQQLNLHHEVINVHGSGSLVTEISLLQNAVDHPADAEICWDFLSRWRATFQKTSIHQHLKTCPKRPHWGHTLRLTTLCTEQ